MNQLRYLIDTNVFIGLEDHKEINPNFSSLLNLAAKHNVEVSIHEAAKDDVKRDKDLSRQKVSLSKLKKFQTLQKVRGLTSQELENSFGPLRKHNDIVDATLLHALSLDIADFLITEDRGLHDRTRRYAPSLSRRVLYVADAVDLLKSTFEPVEVPINAIEEVEAHTIPITDPIFETLKEDYEDFDSWWKSKCVAKRRKCWIVSNNGIAGIVVRKDESPDDTDASLQAQKILKICTFKVRPENRGVKLGELLFKQIFWYAQSNSYDLIYITTFPKQQALIDLLEYYGFVNTVTHENGELIYEKTLSREKLEPQQGLSYYELDRQNYPRFYTGPEINAYGIPIKETYHDELFPELKRQEDLFEAVGISGGPRRPGNTIRKVYLCKAQANIQQPGALLFFYKGKSDSHPSQAMTTVGVLEDMTLATSTKELMLLAGGRSVYSESQIESWKASADRPVKVINFLLSGYISDEISIKELQKFDVMKKHPCQSIFKIERPQLELLLKRLNFGFEV